MKCTYYWGLQASTQACHFDRSRLRDQSKFLMPAIIGKAKSSGDDKHAAELFDITLKKAKGKGWLDGPLLQDEVT